jgi:uncharacterized repeat protein (TIGR01451 family)
VIHPGDTASFTISVTNNYPGPAAANVLLTDQLPAAGLLYWRASSSAFTVSVSTADFLTATLPSLPAGATATITVSAVIPLDLFGPAFPVPLDGLLPSGPLELDGNALNDPAVARDDWANVVFGDGGSALAHSFVTDAVNSPRDDVFTGRGSTDTQGIQAGPWKFTDAKPEAKNDIAHAYAARYTDPGNGHVILYAGLDRYDNSGDASAGFWILQNPVGLSTANPSKEGSPFISTHTDGDILLLSDFTQGGSAAAVQVFRWVGDDSTGSLQAVTALPGSTFAIVNGAPIRVPWSYTNKRHESQPAAGEFLEEGVDLTALGLDGCFTRFLAETRSPQSPTGRPSDFVIGNFNTCRLDLSNTAAVQADGVGPIRSNSVLITVLHKDAALAANLEVSAPVPVTPADSLIGGIFQSARGGFLRGANLPMRLTDVLAGIAAPAEFSLWRHVASDAASAPTWDDDETAALHAVSLDQIFKKVGEENGLLRGKGSVRDEGLLNVMSDLWEPSWEGPAPVKL